MWCPVSLTLKRHRALAWSGLGDEGMQEFCGMRGFSVCCHSRKHYATEMHSGDDGEMGEKRKKTHPGRVDTCRCSARCESSMLCLSQNGSQNISLTRGCLEHFCPIIPVWFPACCCHGSLLCIGRIRIWRVNVLDQRGIRVEFRQTTAVGKLGRTRWHLPYLLPF